MTKKDIVESLHTGPVEQVRLAFLDLLMRYFRVSVHGIKNIPARGPAIVVANHSGYAGADAIVLAHVIHKKRGRSPRILAHRAFFEWSRLIRSVSESFNLREASMENGVALLKRKRLLLMFPEAEEGNFKPSRERYRLRRFHTGFARMALLAGAPVVPCLVVGAEESHLNFGSLNLSRLFPKLRLPLPINFFPLPAKWSIRFLEPIHLPKRYTADDAGDRAAMEGLATEIRVRMQEALDREVGSRGYVFVRGPRWLDGALGRLRRR